MLDDHKYSLYRIVVYRLPNPAYPDSAYGPGGSARTYGLIIGVHCVPDPPPHWEYTVRNAFTREEHRIPEDQIFHGANNEYLDLHRRDDIRWAQPTPETIRKELANSFWKRSLKNFIRTAIPRIRLKEREEEEARLQGRNLHLQPGDYIRVRGDIRPYNEKHHNLYAKVLSVLPPNCEYIDVPDNIPGVSPGKHKVSAMYHVLLDNGEEADIYDVEVKNIYTSEGKKIIHNWRAATFLAEAFGDEPPYDLQLEYLNGHVFSRSELSDLSQEELADLLARLLYSKGLITHEEINEKISLFVISPREYLVDQILAYSRFDMRRNRQLTNTEIESFRSNEQKLRKLLQ
jgi:dsDNA-binding SOS-regulon protein